MKDSKSKIRFNIFDAIICLAVISCITAVVLKVVYFDKRNAENEQVTVDFAVYDIMDNTAACAGKGNVYLAANDEYLGEIISSQISANRIYVANESSLHVVDNPLGKKALTGKMKFSGISSETGFFINGNIKISVGSTLSVYILNPETGDGAAVEITVNSIEVDSTEK